MAAQLFRHRLHLRVDTPRKYISIRFATSALFPPVGGARTARPEPSLAVRSHPRHQRPSVIAAADARPPRDTTPNTSRPQAKIVQGKPFTTSVLCAVSFYGERQSDFV